METDRLVINLRFIFEFGVAPDIRNSPRWKSLLFSCLSPHLPVRVGWGGVSIFIKIFKTAKKNII